MIRIASLQSVVSELFMSMHRINSIIGSAQILTFQFLFTFRTAARDRWASVFIGEQTTKQKSAEL